MVQKDFKLSLDKGNKLKEGHGGLPSEKALCVCEEGRRKRRMKYKKGCWFLCVQGSSMEGMCARIKHRKSVCKN